ncbi:unnamed protein product [Trichogramma brassicae]|uniref:Uncharacterized protein n=1 Tax=Trichogramma brassicae TaxID=86971 RepID=A0A6H5ISC0_9HYME|nr:unnamed protein product [Trichogramma brassicae]
MPTASEIRNLEREARKAARGSDDTKSMVDRIVEMEDEEVLRELAKSVCEHAGPGEGGAKSSAAVDASITRL